MDEVEINVYDNNVFVKYLFILDSSINFVLVNFNIFVEEVISEVDFIIDEVSSSFGVYNINDE